LGGEGEEEEDRFEEEEAIALAAIPVASELAQPSVQCALAPSVRPVARAGSCATPPSLPPAAAPAQDGACFMPSRTKGPRDANTGASLDGKVRATTGKVRQG
jgi:hypothetical protein